MDGHTLSYDEYVIMDPKQVKRGVWVLLTNDAINEFNQKKHLIRL